MSFITDDFLLSTPTASELYHGHAADQPIIDYHCHLIPEELAINRKFETLFDIWLAGDHYKWRAMRLNGESESFCTGDADPYDKFLAFARTVPKTIRNPLYHWSHLELKRYFGIDTLLNEASAPAIWEQANEQLQSEGLSAWGILKAQKVEVIGTTDDPSDDLSHHLAAKKSECPAVVLPSFRPDRAFGVDNAKVWNQWVDSLEQVSGKSCGDFDSFLSALKQRVEFFSEVGCVASDHGLESCPRSICTETEARNIFDEARSGNSANAAEAESFTGFLLCWLGEQYHKQGWAMQLHLGAIRNVNIGMFEQLGADIGCDSIHDVSQIQGLSLVLGELSRRNALPNTILYNLDPAKNYAFATMCGNFFEEGVKGKIQFGSGWWFLDQLEGMTMQINALSSLGLLSNFIGMLTDSRSFMSYPRHEYFRRLLCRIIGQDVADGQIPNDMDLLGTMVSDISYHNAKRYFSI